MIILLSRALLFCIVLFFTLLQTSYANYTLLQNTENGATHTFSKNNENTEFTLSDSYDSIAVEISNFSHIKTPPLILFSENSGSSWHVLNFNTDSKTDVHEKENNEKIYSDLFFIQNESHNFIFKTKLAGNYENITFHFFKDDTPSQLHANNNYFKDTASLGYERDEAFFQKNGIIRRESWGANETYRYTNQSSPIPITNPNEETNSIVSERAKACNETYAQNPQDFQKSEEVYTDTNGDLKWQYQYSPEIKKIIIHHTGTNNEKYSDKTPEEVMRAMYKFHANTKNWGDIGYHFIISPQGAIYEGKAGGDFIIGGHAYCANTKTIGIALMGNYEDEQMNKAQMIALKRLITGLSEKYKINPSHSSYFLGKTTPNLIGHKDYGNTLCPGENVYKYLEAMRETFRVSDFGSTPAYHNPYSIPEYTTSTPIPNPTPHISPASLISRPTIGDTTSHVISEISEVKAHIAPPKKNIRIKLSYSSDLIQITGKNITLEINDISQTIKKRRAIITTGKNNFGNTVLYIDGKQVNKIRLTNQNSKIPLKIASWARPLPWAPTEHDNLFLGTLEIQIIDNTPVIINELPLEDYIKGIAEVSNTDPIEKQKVIAVIARTYAQFYMDPNNRKFPNMPYDGDDTPEHFQKYRGYGYQKRSPLFVQAVKATESEVVSYNDTIIKTPFFSESAGRTLSAQEKWGWTHTPYLKSVNDVFCKNGQGTLKGHGVGLSGCGAETMARRGSSYKDIIQYYYTGVEIY